MATSHVKVPAPAGDDTKTKPAAKRTAKKAPTRKAPAKKRTPAAPPPDPEHPWEQQPDETDAAYAAFRVFLAMGLRRSLRKVRTEWGQFGDSQGVNPNRPPSMTSIEKWTRENSWKLRVQAWDKHVVADWELEVKERRLAAARRDADMADQGMRLVARRIEQMTKHYDTDSETYDPDVPALDTLDLRRLAVTFNLLESRALGILGANGKPAGGTGGSGSDDSDLDDEVTLLTDEERLDRMREIRDEIDQRLTRDGMAS